jgi:hypothetical protein
MQWSDSADVATRSSPKSGARSESSHFGVDRLTVAAEADADTKRRSDDVRTVLARSRRFARADDRSGAGVVQHLRRAADLRRRSRTVER